MCSVLIAGPFLRAGVCDEDVTGVTTHGDVRGRCPNNAVPTRTHVEPCLTAPRGRWTSPPTVRGAAGRPVPAGARPANARRPRRVGIQRRDAHQPDELQALARTAPGAEFVDQVRAADVDPAPRDVAVEADLDVDPQRLGPPPSASARPRPGPARRSPWRCRRSARRRPSPRSTAPCCAGSGRPCASESADRARGIAFGDLAAASCSRDSPKAGQPKRDKIVHRLPERIS